MSESTFLVVRQASEGVESVVDRHTHPDPDTARIRAESAAQRFTRLDSAGGRPATYIVREES